MRRNGSINNAHTNSSEANRGKRKVGGKTPGPEWQFATNLNRFIDWRCNLCGITKSGGAPRIREHLMGSGSGSRGIGVKCKGVGAGTASTHLKEVLEKLGIGNKRPRISMPSLMPFEHIIHIGNTPCDQNNNDNTSIPITTNTSASLEFQVGSSKARQVILERSFCATALEDAQLALAQAIYVTSGSLAMVTHDAWKSAWKKIGEYGPGFTPPTYHHMPNQLLNKCYSNTEKEVDRLIIKSIDQCGCTIVSDGWSNVQRWPLINIMVFCPRGEHFMKAIDSSGEIKSSGYIAKVIAPVIEQIGSKNVVQVIMDNVTNCKLAGRLLQQ